MYHPFDIVWAQVDWRGCADERPWLILDERDQDECYGAFPISSKNYPSAGPCTIVAINHVDFHETGLKDRSNIFYQSVIEIGNEEIRKKIGELVGGLRKSLIENSGLQS